MPAPAPLRPPEGDDWLALTDAVLPRERALEWVEGKRWGGVVGFFGVVRDHAEGRSDVVAVDYEAYETQVLPRLSELAAAARSRVPALGRIVLWHRAGHLGVGETSVAVVVSAPHRGEAFDACRFLIDTLKTTLPIWKLEHWAGGSDWSPSARAVEDVERS
ncbi:MAG TPA: molybdenum cofactor biosynthesis protein MoaE [Acidimicrobiales bacterium]|nr:molybdenum cofactor biosynthesis protein MoaE [Acidimicrobiales bacterium]